MCSSPFGIHDNKKSQSILPVIIALFDALVMAYGHQRPEAPQGSIRPLLVTGRPISEASTLPPHFFVMAVFII